MLKTNEAKGALNKMLRDAGFNIKKPDLTLIISIFKEFSKVDIDCSSDAFLFQCGVYNFTGEELFYWDIVRQFEIEVDNEYDHMEQLHFEVKFIPTQDLRKFNITKWSFELESDEYFSMVESLEEFTVPFKEYIPKSIAIYQEEV